MIDIAKAVLAMQQTTDDSGEQDVEGHISTLSALADCRSQL